VRRRSRAAVAWERLLSLIVPARAVQQATPRTRIILADLGDERFAFHAGQAVFAGLATSTVRRPYSIACSPGQAARTRAVELLVQIDDHAAPDPHLERATPGTLLSIEGPVGSFELPSPLPEPRLLLIAGGTGIAPLRSILWDTLERHPEVAIEVLYSARAPEEFAYFDELSRLAAEGRLHLVSTVTREPPAAWRGGHGRIDDRRIRSLITSTVTRCLICGPPGLVAAATELLQNAGVAPERIQTETYGAA
jgi:ring-1,2-phenylacetyl-CoA epoxidase subunit PaaE